MQSWKIQNRLEQDAYRTQAILLNEAGLVASQA